MAAQDSPDRRARRWRRRRHWVVGAFCGGAVAGLVAWSLPSQEPGRALTPVPGKSDAWVLLEARNRDGSLAVPPAVLRSHENLRFHTRDPSQPEEVRIDTGYRPNSVLRVNLKDLSGRADRAERGRRSAQGTDMGRASCIACIRTGMVHVHEGVAAFDT